MNEIYHPDVIYIQVNERIFLKILSFHHIILMLDANDIYAQKYQLKD